MKQINVGEVITATAIRVEHSEMWGRVLIGDNPRERVVGRVVEVGDGATFTATIDCGDDGTIEFFSFEEIESFGHPTYIYHS